MYLFTCVIVIELCCAVLCCVVQRVVSGAALQSIRKRLTAHDTSFKGHHASRGMRTINFLIMCVVSFTFVTCEFVVTFTCKRAQLNTIAHCIAQLAHAQCTINRPSNQTSRPRTCHQEVNQATREIGNQ